MDDTGTDDIAPESSIPPSAVQFFTINRYQLAHFVILLCQIFRPFYVNIIASSSILSAVLALFNY